MDLVDLPTSPTTELPTRDDFTLVCRKRTRNSPKKIIKSTNPIVEVPSRARLVRDLVSKARDLLQQALPVASLEQASRLVLVQQELELIQNNQPPKEDSPRKELNQNVQSLRQDLKRVENSLKEAKKTPSYAQIASTNSSPNPRTSSTSPNSRTIVQSTSPISRTSQPTNSSNRASYKEKRVILITSQKKSQKIDAFSLRNKVNKAFQEKLGLKDLVIATITSSTSGNLILTTTSSYNGQFLLEKEEIFKPFFDYTRAQKDEQWARIIAHNIPLLPFSRSDGLEDLEREIRLFN